MEPRIIDNLKKKQRGIKKIYGVERVAMSYEAYDNFEPKNGAKYEWKNGFAIKSGTFMKNTERYLISNINRKFIKSKYFEMGELFTETRCKLDSYTTRIPDLAFFTKDQIKISAQDQHPIPGFVIEIISKNENTFETETKVTEYFDAGIEVVWHVFPTLRQVWVFSNNKSVSICTNHDLCIAKTHILNFSMTANEIFEISS